MKTIKIENGWVSIKDGQNLSITESSRHLIKSCSNLYCSIWKEPPWNEDFWQPEEVHQTMLNELTKKESVAILEVSEESAVCGFTWGYEVDIKAMQAIAGHFKLDWLFDYRNYSNQKDPKVFYLDELGVKKEQRCQGVGEKISKTLLKEIAVRGFTLVILRTDVKAIPARLLYEKLGFSELPITDKAYPSRSYWKKEI